ncbi:pyridoxal-dependent decarboxylase, exosortase A system-associated [Alterisphingorhabdus coralli]|uniref:Pyridoxal-dependent decarboxylase, exosortase A system-associated n=1 Tax=Alterisphingorhabdus coralli TaxID=3071408 RepID=A0AA97F5F9_9SPHN|nr:pyridoxal-dependent decarboxylase, exosortase A system-associated [Parasphingorhabdus sp. SCSIO 66989]WOE73776.1 pyridoxal-dependent decarboxylase, exosortase A system-associated [Parasphingorhabdus sp. SCSIO 66989]
MTRKAKPFGLIPEGFANGGEDVLIGGQTVQDWAEEIGTTPFFLYSADLLRQRMADLRAAMPNRLAIHYAMKANPFAPLLKLMTEISDGIDIASAGELAMAMAAGATTDRISFAGPAKRNADLEAAISQGVTLNLESEGEAERALTIAERLGKTPRLAVRVNPDFELKGSGMRMGGGAKAFGVDQARVPALIRRIIDAGAEYRGLHIYAGSQALDAQALIDAQANTLRLAAELSDAVGIALPHCNLGGGFGIPYFPKEIPLDIQSIGEALDEQFAKLPDSLKTCDFAIELGRYLVGEAGIYVTRIIDRKESHGEIFLTCDGGLHHQLAASGNFGTVVRRNYPVAMAANRDRGEEIVSVVGCLCTPLDRLADSVSLPRAESGDLVVIFCAGAYGASASPVNFLGHGAAQERLV